MIYLYIYINEVTKTKIKKLLRTLTITNHLFTINERNITRKKKDEDFTNHISL